MTAPKIPIGGMEAWREQNRIKSRERYHRGNYNATQKKYIQRKRELGLLNTPELRATRRAYYARNREQINANRRINGRQTRQQRSPDEERAYRRELYQRNREAKRARTHTEKYHAMVHDYYLRNRERIRTKARKWYERNRERVNAKQRAKRRAYRDLRGMPADLSKHYGAPRSFDPDTKHRIGGRRALQFWLDPITRVRQTPEQVQTKRREWYERNRERLRIRHHEYYLRTKEHHSARGKAYRLANLERLTKQNREYYRQNKERYAIRQREYNRKNAARLKAQHHEYYMRTKETRSPQIRAYRQKYKAEHREKINAKNRIYEQLGPSNPQGALQWLRKARALLKNSRRISEKNRLNQPLSSTEASAMQQISSMLRSPSVVTQSINE